MSSPTQEQAVLDITPPGQTEVLAPGEWLLQVAEAQAPLRRVLRVPQPPSPRRHRKATPKELAIGTLPDSRLRLLVPLVVTMRREGDFSIAHCQDLEEFGYGPYPMDAVDDLRQTVVELYWSLKEEQERLGADLAELWRRLQGVIEER